MRKITNFSCYFFDFDGVILESASIKTEAFGELYEAQGISEQVIEYHLAHQGVSRYEKFDWIAKNLLNTTISEEESKELGAEFTRLVKQKILAAPFVEGVEEVLKKLKSENKKMVIASGTPQNELRTIAKERNIDTYFNEIHGSPTKKDTIVKNYTAQEGINVADCLFLGDASTDYEAAQKSGTHFFARLTPELVDYWRDKEVTFKKNNFKGLV